MHKYVIIGVQGCGKGTQAQLMRRDLDIVHISVGDIFRWHIQNHTKLAAKIRRIVNSGQLVSDELVAEIVDRRLQEHDWNYGFVLDGFPRNVKQAEFFLEHYDIDAVIHIEISDDVVKERVLARRLCEDCGLDYNLIHHRPKVENVCDVCKGKLLKREDDNEEALKDRIREYHEKTEPVMDLFLKKELIFHVDGTASPEEVQKEIRRKMELRGAVN